MTIYQKEMIRKSNCIGCEATCDTANVGKTVRYHVVSTFDFEIIWVETFGNLQKTYGNWRSFMLDLSARERGDEGVVSLWHHCFDILMHGRSLRAIG